MVKSSITVPRKNLHNCYRFSLIRRRRREESGSQFTCNNNIAAVAYLVHSPRSIGLFASYCMYDTLSMSFQIEAHSLLARRPTDRFVAKAEPVGGSVIDINWLSIKLAISIRR